MTGGWELEKIGIGILNYPKLNNEGNLNMNSTHPNPWRPPTQFDGSMLLWQPWRIFNGSPTHLRPNRRNYLVEGSISNRLAKSFVVGTAAGGIFCLPDILAEDRSPKIKVARTFYFVGPIVAATVGWVAVRELLALYSGRKDPWYSFIGASAYSGALFGYFHKNFSIGYLIFLAASSMSIYYNHMTKSGFQMFGARETPHNQDLGIEGTNNYFKSYILSPDDPIHKLVYQEKGEKGFFNVPGEDEPEWKRFTDEDGNLLPKYQKKND